MIQFNEQERIDLHMAVISRISEIERIILNRSDNQFAVPWHNYSTEYVRMKKLEHKLVYDKVSEPSDDADFSNANSPTGEVE